MSAGATTEVADALLKWVLLCCAVFAGIVARAGYQLGGHPPPEDPAEYLKWRRRQLWAAVGEFLSIPMLAASWLLAERYFGLRPEVLIGGCILTGALGFGFCLDGAQRLINRRIENV